MSEMETSMRDADLSLTQGAIVTGTLVRVEAEAAYVQIDNQGEGQIARSQWSTVSGPALTEMASVGETVRASVLGVADDGTVRLSRKNAVDSATWAQLRDESLQERIRAVKIISVVKGGMVADVEGLRAFIPASLVDVRFVSDLKPFQGQVVPTVITEVDEAERKVILSRRRAVELDDARHRGERLGQFHVGQVVSGKVARFTTFGAFVDIGDVDGLLHVSEMGWSRVERPQDVLAVGQEIEVKILRIDPENGKLSLSLRETLNMRDDDYRLSFLHGNFVTLTNLRPGELERMAQLKMSPINISVHATNPELRVRLLGNKRSGEILEQIAYLAENGIEMNT
ncbi:MAG: S1 RNA-binding domain-containing protein, partial [Firmicutes bacterium]|nr:S1 RNA-binding domain-containing protein [Bacillota bacterium]